MTTVTEKVAQIDALINQLLQLAKELPALAIDESRPVGDRADALRALYLAYPKVQAIEDVLCEAEEIECRALPDDLKGKIFNETSDQSSAISEEETEANFNKAVQAYAEYCEVNNLVFQQPSRADSLVYSRMIKLYNGEGFLAYYGINQGRILNEPI